MPKTVRIDIPNLWNCGVCVCTLYVKRVNVLCFLNAKSNVFKGKMLVCGGKRKNRMVQLSVPDKVDLYRGAALW